MAEEEEDESLLVEMEKSVNDVEIKLASEEVKAILSGESDFNNAIISINSVQEEQNLKIGHKCY